MVIINKIKNIANSFKADERQPIAVVPLSTCMYSYINKDNKHIIYKHFCIHIKINNIVHRIILTSQRDFMRKRILEDMLKKHFMVKIYEKHQWIIDDEKVDYYDIFVDLSDGEILFDYPLMLTPFNEGKSKKYDQDLIKQFIEESKKKI